MTTARLIQRLAFSDVGFRLQGALLPRLLAAPAPLLRRLAGEIPRREGVELDLQVAALLAQASQLGLPAMHALGVEGSRAQLEHTGRLLGGRPAPLRRTRDLWLDLPGRRLAARHYVPKGLRAPYPTLLFFHGGGFVLGSIHSHDLVCRRLAASSGVAILSLGYRLAPEHPAPAAIDDALEAWAWLHEHAAALDLDTDRLAVGGDSAGGNLAAVLCLSLQQARRLQPRLQLLLYPATDALRQTRSLSEYGTGFILEAEGMRWFQEQYLRGGLEPRDWRISPLRAPSHAGLAPAIVHTGGFDPLRDEGEAYAAALRDAQVEVSLQRWPDLPHGYLNLAGTIRAAGRALDHLALALHLALHAARS